MVIVASTCKHVHKLASIRNWEKNIRILNFFFLFLQLFDRYFHYSINIRIYTALLLVIVLPIGLIRFLKYLVPFSTLANVSLFVAIGLIMSEVFKQLPAISSRPVIESPTKWPLFISAAFTSMEGVGVVSASPPHSRCKRLRIKPYSILPDYAVGK